MQFSVKFRTESRFSEIGFNREAFLSESGCFNPDLKNSRPAFCHLIEGDLWLGLRQTFRKRFPVLNAFARLPIDVDPFHR
jgi:hypothetical protein